MYELERKLLTTRKKVEDNTKESCGLQRRKLRTAQNKAEESCRLRERKLGTTKKKAADYRAENCGLRDRK